MEFNSIFTVKASSGCFDHDYDSVIKTFLVYFNQRWFDAPVAKAKTLCQFTATVKNFSTNWCHILTSPFNLIIRPLNFSVSQCVYHPERYHRTRNKYSHRVVFELMITLHQYYKFSEWKSLVIISLVHEIYRSNSMDANGMAFVQLLVIDEL